MRKKQQAVSQGRKSFHLEFLNTAQKIAWSAFEQHDILFLVGPPGTAKSHLAMAFAVSEILAKKKRKIILTRPIVEAGEKLGYLPGDFNEKVNPYMVPLYDCLSRIVGEEGVEREKVNRSMEIAPLGFLRGRTFHDAICILDEAQNASLMQLKLFLTRLGDNSKMIITADLKQCDIAAVPALKEVIEKLKPEPGIGVIEFNNSSIVRHPLVGRILDLLS